MSTKEDNSSSHDCSSPEDHEHTKEAKMVTTSTDQSDPVDPPKGVKLVLLMSCILITSFLVALDRTIVATAVPNITDEFHANDDIGWYGSAYLLTLCAFQLPFGRVYKVFNVKWTYLVSLLLFEIGSALCGAAPRSSAFIVGRSICGIGAAGLLCGTLVIITYTIPLHKRPIFQGFFGAFFSIASIAGPVLGGAFTTRVSWRWCFYINLPLGGAAFCFLLMFLNVEGSRKAKDVSIKEGLASLDLSGLMVLAAGVVCLLLALQWGGIVYSWSDGRIIALLVLTGILFSGFLALELLRPTTATLSRRIIKQRSILAAFCSAFCLGSQQIIFVYYLPIWFQAIQYVSALQSGIRTLPIVIATLVASIVAGVLTSKIGYYTPFLIIGICFTSIGAGLLTTLQVQTPERYLIGFQVLYGFGTGLCTQVPNMAAQTVLPKDDVSIGVSFMFFAQLLGGAIFASVGQNVLDNNLVNQLEGLPGFNASTLINSGATTLTTLAAQDEPLVTSAYNYALTVVFRIGLGMACIGIIGSLFMEWKSVKKNKTKNTTEAKAEKGEATQSSVC